MQTFLPYPDFQESARVLDVKRLGKQRLECQALLKAIFTNSGWINHPACRMWIGYEPALCYYHDAVIKEWISRGYNNTMKLITTDDRSEFTYFPPKWMGNPKFHLSHRSNLMRKDAKYYSQYFGSDCPNDLPYEWNREYFLDYNCHTKLEDLEQLGFDMTTFKEGL